VTPRPDAAAAPAVVERCPACGEPPVAGDRYCEGCGHPLGEPAPAPAPVPATPPAEAPATTMTTATAATAPPAPAPAGAPVPCPCGGGNADADGYCDSCGTLVTTAGRRTEVSGPASALVSDPGRAYPRNEDAGAVGEQDGLVFAVVCDGVSSAPRSDEAARAAVGAAEATLRDHLPGGEPAGALRAAAVAAAAAVTALAAGRTEPDGGVPACTFVAAVGRPAGDLHVAHVGDSRAYWLPDAGPPSQLTVDDSWATEAVAAGIEPDVARADRRAHMITSWLGADADPVEPRLGSVPLPGPGLVLLCSDGLWGYLPDLAALAGAVRSAYRDAAGDLLGCARLLVDLACDRGGRDNITVALLRAGGPPTDHAVPKESGHR
jgi:serine/threonine protein phosphatase PrpC